MADCTICFYMFRVMLFLLGETFVKELDHVLGIADEAQQSKTLKQFQEWDKNARGYPGAVSLSMCASISRTDV